MPQANRSCGSLVRENDDELLVPIAALLSERRYRNVGATHGWHPANHVRFPSQHAGKLPFQAIVQHAQL
ncbi:hypothetical protein [Stenotrophomonas sp. PS02300]|uniref:hypothetical protein n=1 Tax=Stenotrophomonas sp. PS02300 TaxID=2991426 RepID=UPI00249C34AE|nr:hypothetical protein [Stenotrophomonas sp. PS02300]